MSKHNPFLGTLVHEVAHMLRLDIDRRLKNHHLTRVQWIALQALQLKPRLTQTELARELNVGAATVGRLVDRLENQQLVQRMADPDDRRATLLKITSKAGRTLAELDRLPSELHQDLMGGMTDLELASLRQGLTKIGKNLRNKLSLASAGFAMFQIGEGLDLIAVTAIGTVL